MFLWQEYSKKGRNRKKNTTTFDTLNLVLFVNKNKLFLRLFKKKKKTILD